MVELKPTLVAAGVGESTRDAGRTCERTPASGEGDPAICQERRYNQPAQPSLHRTATHLRRNRNLRLIVPVKQHLLYFDGVLLTVFLQVKALIPILLVRVVVSRRSAGSAFRVGLKTGKDVELGVQLDLGFERLGKESVGWLSRRKE
jgi:hypothetical protein